MLTKLFAVSLCDPHWLQVVVELASLVQQPQGMQGSSLLAGLAGGSRGRVVNLWHDTTELLIFGADALTSTWWANSR